MKIINRNAAEHLWSKMAQESDTLDGAVTALNLPPKLTPFPEPLLRKDGSLYIQGLDPLPGDPTDEDVYKRGNQLAKARDEHYMVARWLEQMSQALVEDINCIT